MATAKAETETITSVTLTLTHEEAMMLRGVLGQFLYGGPTGGVYSALADAGIESNGYVTVGETEPRQALQYKVV
jgi:hypothetical protein